MILVCKQGKDRYCIFDTSRSEFIFTNMTRELLIEELEFLGGNTKDAYNPKRFSEIAKLLIEKDEEIIRLG